MAGRKSDFTLPTLDDIFSTQEQREEAKLAKIRDIPISEIDDFPNHPFKVRDVLLNEKHGQAIKEFQNIEAKYRMRALRSGHAFDVNDGNFEEHHPEVVTYEDIVEQIDMQDKISRIREMLNRLPEAQKRRLIKHFFYNKSSREIAKEKGVNYSAVDKSIALGLEKLKKLF